MSENIITTGQLSLPRVQADFGDLANLVQTSQSKCEVLDCKKNWENWHIKEFWLYL